MDKGVVSGDLLLNLQLCPEGAMVVLFAGSSRSTYDIAGEGEAGYGSSLPILCFRWTWTPAPLLLGKDRSQIRHTAEIFSDISL
jgi:hypothetical protein